MIRSYYLSDLILYHFLSYSLYSRPSSYSTYNMDIAFNHDIFEAYFLPLTMMIFTSQPSPALNVCGRSSMQQQKSSTYHSSKTFHLHSCSVSKPRLYKPIYWRLEPTILKAVLT